MFLAEWIETIRATVRPSTWASYERNLRVHVVPRIGGFPLQAVDAGTISKLYASLLADGHRSVNGYAKPDDESTNPRPAGLAPRTVAYIGTILHRAFDDAVRWGRLVRNPVDAVKRPKVPSASSTVVAWDATTLGDFLQRSRTYRGKGGRVDRCYALWLLLATTGLRRGEALGLRWSDIDFDERVLSVSQTVIAVDHVQSIGTPKTSAGARAIELDGVTVAALRDHRRAQLEERLLVGAGFTDRGFVFCLPDVGRTTRSGYQQSSTGGCRSGRSSGSPCTGCAIRGRRSRCGRRASEGCAGATRALHHWRHAEHLFARVSRDAARRGGEGSGPHFRSVTGPRILPEGMTFRDTLAGCPPLSPCDLTMNRSGRSGSSMHAACLPQTRFGRR